jgi:probable HAF family extracellular repeat protein
MLAQAEVLSMGALPGNVVQVLSSASVAGLSADGSIAVGSVRDSTAGNAYRAFRWTQSSGLVAIGALNGGLFSYAEGVSANGAVIAGTAGDGALGNASRAYRWTQATGMRSLGVLNGGNESAAYDISGDGDVIVGVADDGAESNAFRAFRWTQATGMQSLGTMNNGLSSYARAVSRDGTTVVGFAHNGTSGNATRAFRWTQAGGMESLGTFAGGAYSYANGVSGNGSAVVGYSASAAGDRAFRWTQAGGLKDLGTLNNGSSSTAYGISTDGLVVVGSSNDGAAGNANRGFRWTQATGMQSIAQWLAEAGVTVAADFKPQIAHATNADGSVVAGTMTDGGPFLARSWTPGPAAGPAPSPGASFGQNSGSGIIRLNDYVQTLGQPAAARSQMLADASVIMHGLHGIPMRMQLREGQQGAWVAGEWGQFTRSGANGDIGAGEIGFSHGFSDNVTIRAALGRTHTHQNLLYGGRASIQGTYLAPEIIVKVASAPDLRLSASGYYNWGNADIKRNYVNAGNVVGSSGTPGASTAALRLRVDWIDALAQGGLSLSPYTSLTHYRTSLKAYTESGGGFPVAWNARAENATEARLGADATWRANDGLTLLGRLEGVRRLNRQGGGVSGTLIGPGGFSFENAGQAGKQNWLRTGLGLDAKLGAGTASAMLNLSTDSEGPKRWASASYRIEW